MGTVWARVTCVRASHYFCGAVVLMVGGCAGGRAMRWSASPQPTPAGWCPPHMSAAGAIFGRPTPPSGPPHGFHVISRNCQAHTLPHARTSPYGRMPHPPCFGFIARAVHCVAVGSNGVPNHFGPSRPAPAPPRRVKARAIDFGLGWGCSIYGPQDLRPPVLS